MPELPEVETVVRGLRPILVGERIERVVNRAPKASVVVSKTFKRTSFETLLSGKKVERVERRGKNILIYLEGDLLWWVHLKMTGHFYHKSRTEPIEKHDLLLFELSSTASNGLHLRFNDYRRFGRNRLYRTSEIPTLAGLGDLGPEPLEISESEFVELFQSRSRQLKAALLDQTFLAGVGNIYADESLWASRLHPKKETAQISRPKLLELRSHLQEIMNRSIGLMGSSVDTYSGVNGQVGEFQNYLSVYGREGEACKRCATRIRREKIGARSAHYCPRCQRV